MGKRRILKGTKSPQEMRILYNLPQGKEIGIRPFGDKSPFLLRDNREYEFELGFTTGGPFAYHIREVNQEDNKINLCNFKRSAGIARSNSKNKHDNNGNVSESTSRPERVVSKSSQQKYQSKFSQESKLHVDNPREEDLREINQNIAELSLHEGQNIDRKTDDQNQTQRFYPYQQDSQHISQTVTQDHSQADHPQHSYQAAPSQDYPEEEYSLNPMQVEYLQLQEWILAKDKEQGNRMWSGRDQATLRMHNLWDELGKQEQN